MVQLRMLQELILHHQSSEHLTILDVTRITASGVAASADAATGLQEKINTWFRDKSWETNILNGNERDTDLAEHLKERLHKVYSKFKLVLVCIHNRSSS